MVEKIIIQVSVLREQYHCSGNLSTSDLSQKLKEEMKELIEFAEVCK